MNAASTRMSMPLDRIAVVDRLRPLSEVAVGDLMPSLSNCGLISAIIVRPMPPLHGADHALVAGLHRLEAARRLGWAEIACDIRPLGDDAARMIEIDENLKRSELNVLDRAMFLTEREAVWARLYPHLVGKGGDRRSETYQSQFGKLVDGPVLPGQLAGERFSKNAARLLKMKQQTIYDGLEIGRKLDAAARELIRSTPAAHSPNQLLILAREKPEDQLRIATAIADGAARDVRSARVALGLTDATDRPVKQVSPDRLYTLATDAFGALPEQQRRLFVKWLRAEGHL